MPCYRAYGLTLASSLPLPELHPATGTPDVYIRVGSVPTPPIPPSAQSELGWIVAAEECVVAHLEQAATFLVRGGCEITIEPAPGAAEPTLRACLLGSALGLLLQQRGRLVLHASAVAFHAGVVAFLARSGRGKSTLAAALHARGHPLVADDVMAVQMDGDAATVDPGFPHFKLWPDAVAALGETADDLPRLHPAAEKRLRPAAGAVGREPRPLRCVYVLTDGPTPTSEALTPRQAFLALVRHSYSARGLAGGQVGRHFAQCSALAACVPVRALRRPHDLRLLPALTRLVMDEQGF